MWGASDREEVPAQAQGDSRGVTSARDPWAAPPEPRKPASLRGDHGDGIDDGDGSKHGRKMNSFLKTSASTEKKTRTPSFTCDEMTARPPPLSSSYSFSPDPLDYSFNPASDTASTESFLPQGRDGSLDGSEAALSAGHFSMEMEEPFIRRAASSVPRKGKSTESPMGVDEIAFFQNTDQAILKSVLTSPNNPLLVENDGEMIDEINQNVDVGHLKFRKGTHSFTPNQCLSTSPQKDSATEALADENASYLIVARGAAGDVLIGQRSGAEEPMERNDCSAIVNDEGGGMNQTSHAKSSRNISEEAIRQCSAGVLGSDEPFLSQERLEETMKLIADGVSEGVAVVHQCCIDRPSSSSELNTSNIELELIDNDDKQNNLKLVYQSRDEVSKSSALASLWSCLTRNKHLKPAEMVRSNSMNWIVGECLENVDKGLGGGDQMLYSCSNDIVNKDSGPDSKGEINNPKDPNDPEYFGVLRRMECACDTWGNATAIIDAVDDAINFDQEDENNEIVAVGEDELNASLFSEITQQMENLNDSFQSEASQQIVLEREVSQQLALELKLVRSQLERIEKKHADAMVKLLSLKKQNAKLQNQLLQKNTHLEINNKVSWERISSLQSQLVAERSRADRAEADSAAASELARGPQKAVSRAVTKTIRDSVTRLKLRGGRWDDNNGSASPRSMSTPDTEDLVQLELIINDYCISVEATVERLQDKLGWRRKRLAR